MKYTTFYMKNYEKDELNINGIFIHVYIMFDMFYFHLIVYRVHQFKIIIISD